MYAPSPAVRPDPRIELVRSRAVLEAKIEEAGRHCGLVNLSDEPLDDLFALPAVDWLLDRGVMQRGGQRTVYTWLPNPDGSIRFLFDARMPEPAFLALYNAQGMKGRALRAGLRLGFALGVPRLMARHHRLVLWYKDEHPLAPLLAPVPHDHYAIFTGTAGRNRKAVIALADAQGRVTHFVKFPFTDSAHRLVRNELNTLAELDSFSWRRLCFPKGTELYAGIAVTNVRPARVRPTHQLERPHFEALYELYNRTGTQVEVQDLPVWEKMRLWQGEAHEAAAYTKRFVPYAMERLVDRLELLTDHLRKRQTYAVPVARAHGDFTPWNTFVGAEGRVYAYDWELSQPGMPLLFDAFHYAFQSGILVGHKDYEGISASLARMQRQPVLEAICREYDVDFEWHRWFYLAWVMSYYLPRYLTQINLHTQAYWLINTWSAALDEALSQFGNGVHSGNGKKNRTLVMF